MREFLIVYLKIRHNSRPRELQAIFDLRYSGCVDDIPQPLALYPPDADEV